MKKWVVLLLACVLAAPLGALSLSREAKDEAALFNDFLKAAYALRDGDKDALAQLQRLQRKMPDSAYIKRLIVSAALAEGDMQTAEQNIDFIQSEETDAEAWTVYGVYLTQNEQWPQALAAFEKAMELDPDDGKLLAGYVEALLHTASRPEMVEKLKALIVRYPALTADIYTQIGYVYMAERDWNNALVYYNKALEANPAYAAARVGKIKVYGENNLFIFVYNELTELEKSGYQSPQMYRQIALWHMANNDRTKAEAYFRKAWDMQAGDPMTASYLADFAARRGDYAAALDYVQHSTDYADAPEKWIDAGFYLNKLGKKRERCALLEQAYAKFNDNVKVGYFYALSLQDEKQYKRAAQVYKRLLEIGEPYLEVRMAYAFTLESLKKYDEMENQVRLILAAFPNHAPAMNLLAYSLAERRTRLDDAERFAVRAVGLSPNDISYIDTLGWVYAQGENWEQAEKIFSAISENDTLRNPEIAYHRGLVCLRLQKWDCAEKYLLAGQKEYPAAKKLYKELQKKRVR